MINIYWCLFVNRRGWLQLLAKTIPIATNTKFWVISIVHLPDKCSYMYSMLLFRKLRVQTYWRGEHGILCTSFDLPSTEQFFKKEKLLHLIQVIFIFFEVMKIKFFFYKYFVVYKPKIMK